MIREVFINAHENIINSYDRLKTIKWEGHKFTLAKVKNLKMYKNKRYGALLQDFGTTAVMAAIKADVKGASHLIVANVGDSIAFIGRQEGKSKEDLTPMEDLVKIHNGDDEAEQARISAKGSVVSEGHYISPPEESGFDWAKLAVTRALGHKYFCKYGIIPDPDICDYHIDKHDKYLIITSDGVTDVLSTKEVLDFITQQFVLHPTTNLQKVTTKLVRFSVSMWKKRFVDSKGRGEEADNTSAIVIDLQKIGGNFYDFM